MHLGLIKKPVQSLGVIFCVLTGTMIGEDYVLAQSPQPGGGNGIVQWVNQPGYPQEGQLHGGVAGYPYAQNGSMEGQGVYRFAEGQPEFEPREIEPPAGFKERLENRGITLDFFATQFYQGVAAGGRQQEFEYGGKLDLLTQFNGEKMGLWQGFFVDLHLESRLGHSVNGFDGLLAPSNIAMSFPEPEGNITALTGLKVTQALSENFALYAGKINTLDEFPIRYNSAQGLGRPGIGGFMNTSLVFNPIVARTVPYSAAGIGFAILRELEPVFTFTVFDPAERATTGLQNLYEEGVVLMPDFIVRTDRFGLPGIYNFGGSWSSARYTTLDPAAYLNVPIELGNLPTSRGSWSMYTTFYQALWSDPMNDKRTWGVFGAAGLSEGDTNPIRYSGSLGLGGRVMRPSRPDDTFGIGVFHLGLSSEFRDLASGVLPQRNEQGMELFYNRAIAKNVRATADLQVVRPSTVAFDTSIITGVRLEVFY
jgi:porin